MDDNPVHYNPLLQNYLSDTQNLSKAILKRPSTANPKTKLNLQGEPMVCDWKKLFYHKPNKQ